MIHGSLNKPGDNSVDTVYGEVEINNRILSLNFKDCHAKIRQVDSLETLDKGVVVQVSGELSNNGQPMRRFFQTFVLAPRSPTNYYVRNDIFRYQDEPSAKSDDDDNGDVVERNIETEVPEKMVQQENQQPQSVPVSQSQPSSETFPALQASSSKDSSSGLPNGHVDGNRDFVTSDIMVEQEWDPSHTGSEDKMDESSVPAPVTQPSGPITWAAIIRKQDPDTSGSSFISSNCSTLKPIVSSEAGLHVPSNLSPILPSNSISVPQPSGKSPKGNDSNRSNRRLKKQENRDSTPGAVENQTSVDLGDSPSMVNNKKNVNSGNNSTGAYADDQQVFVGNLPQDITEDTLRQFFSKYGSILDIRINRTNQQKNSNTRTPNYGFVTFDKVEIVQSILRQKVNINCTIMLFC